MKFDYVTNTLNVKMDFNLDIIEIIGKHCDSRTKLNLALTNKQYYKQQIPLFTSKEERYMCFRLDHLLNKLTRGYSRLSRINRAHKLMREIMRFPHQLRIHENLRLQILERMPVWREEGMGKARVEEYTKFLESI